MKRSIEGEFMKYSNMAFTREDENAVISRVQLVQIPVACIYPALTRSILSREFIKRNRGISVVNPVPKNTGPVKAFDVFMKVSDENGVEHKSGKAIKFDPGEKVIVEIGGTGLVENKIKVKADYCYLTPTPAPQSLVNYTLIKNGYVFMTFLLFFVNVSPYLSSIFSSYFRLLIFHFLFRYISRHNVFFTPCSIKTMFTSFCSFFFYGNQI